MLEGKTDDLLFVDMATYLVRCLQTEVFFSVGLMLDFMSLLLYCKHHCKCCIWARKSLISVCCSFRQSALLSFGVLAVLALSHSALTAGFQEAFLANVCFSREFFPGWRLITHAELGLSFKEISAKFLGLVWTKLSWMDLWLKEKIFKDYFLTQNRKQIMKSWGICSKPCQSELLFLAHYFFCVTLSALQ